MPHPSEQPGQPSTIDMDDEAVRELKDELESWISYGRRAVVVLEKLGGVEFDVPKLQRAGLGPLVRRYSKHHDPAVAEAASRLVQKWERLAESRRRTLPASRPRKKRAYVDDDDSDAESF